MPTNLVWIVIVAVAASVTLGLMAWLHCEFRKRGLGFFDRAAGGGRILGTFSPLLVWLKALFTGNPPPATEVSTDAAPRSIPQEGWGLVTAGVLALLGQWTLFSYPTRAGPGLLYYLLAIILFIWVCYRVEGHVLPPPFRAAQQARGAPVFAIGFASLVLCGWTAQSVIMPTPPPFLGRAIVVAWTASIGLFAWSVLRAVEWHLPARATWSAWWRAHGLEVAGVLLIGLLAFGLRVYTLELLPYAMINDEGEVGQEALRVLHGLRMDFFATGWAAQPIWSFVPTAISVGLFGNTTVAVRLVSVVQGTLSVVFIYLLAREAFDRFTAFLAAGLLATLPFHIHFSRLGVCNGIDAFFSSLVLWLTYRALRRGQISGYLWAGLAAGLTIYSYPGSRLVAALAVGLMGYALVGQRDYLRTHWRHLGVFGGGLLIVAAPMLSYFFRHPELFLARLNSEGILNNGWLRHMAAEQGYGAPLWHQFVQSTLVYISSSAPAGFYNSPQPYLVPLAAVFFLLGMSYVVWRLRDWRYLGLLAWFWAVVVLGSMLTVGPPTSQRLIMSAPVLALITAIGLRKVAGLWQSVNVIPFRLGVLLSVVVVGVVGWQGVSFYFIDYVQGHYFEDPGNEIPFEASRYATSLGQSYRLYLMAAPVTVNFGNFKYLLPDMDLQDFNPMTPGDLAALPHDGGAFFVALPSRQADLEAVARQAPGGLWLQITRRYQPDQMLYLGYVLSPGQWAGRWQTPDR